MRFILLALLTISCGTRYNIIHDSSEPEVTINGKACRKANTSYNEERKLIMFNCLDKDSVHVIQRFNVKN